MKIAVRRLAAGDEAILGRVAADVFDGPLEPSRVQDYLSDPNHHLIVATDAGEIVGQVRAVVLRHPDGAPELFIENLGVTPDRQRQGIATRLIRAVLELGRELGCREAWLATEASNVAGRAFYDSLGVPSEAVVMYTFALDDPTRDPR